MKPRAEKWIAGHPISAFFIVGIAICFVTLLPAILIIPREGTLAQLVGLYLARLGVYSPVLAGMYVAHVIKPARARISFARRLLIFLPVWIIAEIIHVADFRLSAAPGTSLLVLIVVSLPIAILPAYVVSSAFSGTDGVREMLATLVRPTGKFIYYLVALLAFPMIQLVGTGITNFLDGKPWFPGITQGGELALVTMITFFSVFFFFGGINEESGWRGFAQRRLQGKYSPLVSNLILWFLMVIWHIPNDIVQYQHGGYLLVRIGLYPFITILLGWVYNRTKGSILAPAIFHASMNSMNPWVRFFPITTAGSILLVGLAIAAAVSDRMWRKLPADHPAVYRDHVAYIPAASST